MDDHVQRFKNLIIAFFTEFLLLFFREWAERIDCSMVEWLDKEVFPDPPKGSRRILDMVAENRSAIIASVGADQQAGRALAVKNVVAQHQRRRLAVHESAPM